MSWLILVLAGLFEIAWAVALKAAEGFTRPVPSVIFVIAMAISVFLLGVAVKTIPIGTGYAVWTGIGAAGTALCGMIWFGESWHWSRLACIGLIVAGVLGLKIMHGGS